MNHLRKPISLFLILVLCFYIVPKEFIHAFYGHTDTADCTTESSSCAKSPLSLSSQHTHCELLNFETTVFYTQDNQPVITAQAIAFYFQPQTHDNPVRYCHAFVSLRGPPFC
jgi:hypothetical protein